MLPTDTSLRHSHKVLAELATSAPPPPYSGLHNSLTEDDDGNDDEDVSLSPPQPPITINIDTSTRIIGHANTIHLPPSPSSPAHIAGMLLAALKSAQQDDGKRGVDIKLEAGFSIYGSRNVVLTGTLGTQGLAMEKRKQSETQGSVNGAQNAASRKRRAESVSGAALWN